MECDYCHEQVPGDSRRCKHCGGELYPCKRCRRRVGVETRRKWVGFLRGGSQDVKRCLHCGSHLHGPRW